MRRATHKDFEHQFSDAFNKDKLVGNMMYDRVPGGWFVRTMRVGCFVPFPAKEVDEMNNPVETTPRSNNET